MRSRVSRSDYLYKDGEGVRVVDLCTAGETAAACGKVMHRSGHPGVRSLSVDAVGGLDPFGQRPNRVGGVGIGRDPRGGTPAGVEDGRVVAPAEGLPDGGKALSRVLAREEHGDLAWPDDLCR